MKYEIGEIRRFREKFNLSCNAKDQTDKKLHLRLIKEEYEELVESIEQDDDANTIKEFVDLVYVIGGYLIDKGLDKYVDTMFDAVTDNNMDKLGEDGKPIYDKGGKLLKPKGFKKLNPQTVIDNYVDNRSYCCNSVALDETLLFLDDDNFDLM